MQTEVTLYHPHPKEAVIETTSTHRLDTGDSAGIANLLAHACRGSAQSSDQSIIVTSGAGHIVATVALADV